MYEKQHLSLPEETNLSIPKNYSGITLTAIATKVYNAQFLNCIQPEVKKILTKNRNNFQRMILTTC